jgi:uncharacterized protein
VVSSWLWMTQVLILPGIGGSGPGHWQTRWEQAQPEYRRIEMPDWDRPELDVWLGRIEQAVRAAGPKVIVVAHSLGCMALAHWAARGGMLHAALLVAVPDPRGQLYPEEAESFSDLPLVPLPFRTCVVASHDDPYGSFEHGRRCAAAWGSELCDVGCAGHVNADSGLGAWAAGQQLLGRLLG